MGGLREEPDWGIPRPNGTRSGQPRLEWGAVTPDADGDLVIGGAASTLALPLPFAMPPPAQGPLLLEEHEGYEVERL